VLVLVVSWMTVTMFVDVFHMCVDTVLMCYLTDMEDHGQAVFAHASLAAFIKSHGKLVAPSNNNNELVTGVSREAMQVRV
jgi:hypothetical protein